MTSASQTHIGYVRDENQDRVGIRQYGENLLLVVCDGMGGERSGSKASSMATDVFFEHFEESYTEDMDAYSIRSLMKAVGVERTVCPDFFRIDLEKDQAFRLLLCSDGLSGFCSDAEIETILKENLSDEETAQKLIDAALEKGGRDNISVALATVSHNTEE